MTQYNPWNDIQETCERLGLREPSLVNRTIWVFRGQDAMPTPLSPEEMGQVVRLTCLRLLQSDKTQRRYARLLIPLSLFSSFLVGVGVYTKSLDGFAAIYHAAPTWLQLPWAIAVFIFTFLILRLFFDSAIETVHAYRTRNPYWKSFAFITLKTANLFLLANLVCKAIAVNFMTQEHFIPSKLSVLWQLFGVWQRFQR